MIYNSFHRADEKLMYALQMKNDQSWQKNQLHHIRKWAAES